jgi:hypothetical protein
MKLWQMSGQEGALVGYIPDGELSVALTRCGMNPVAARNELDLAGASPVDMQLGRPLAAAVEKKPQAIPDIMFWSWIAILSERAVAAASELGCGPDEFWPCRFQSNPNDAFFFHLPTSIVDFVDVEQSSFRQILPLDPPIPMFIERLVARPLSDPLPPCFRVRIPRTNQIFSELIVREDFKCAWDRLSLRGAKFRQLSS